MTRSTISIVGASKLPRQLSTIISFFFSFPTELNKALYFNIMDDTFLRQTTVTDPKSDTSASFFSTYTYGGEEVESMLDYVNKNAIV